jgi:N-acetylmuramoyl-L-alanine amidase
MYDFCLDPGHGGRTPGAVGFDTGIIEKDINLNVSLKVKDLLISAGKTVLMTRTDDRYISLQDRCRIPNRNFARFFASIHCNSFKDRAAHGITTYCWKKGETGYQAAIVIQDELIEETKLHDRGIKYNYLYVVANTRMPAILIELPFLSNPDEERMLCSEDFRNKCALAIYRGLLRIRF